MTTEKFALKFLALKSLSTDELRNKLTRLRCAEREIEAVIQKFTRLKFLRDDELAESRFQAYLKKGYGPRYIALCLKQQGLIMPSYSSQLQQQVASELLKKMAFRRKTADQQKGALQRRGFDLDVIYTVVKEG